MKQEKLISVDIECYCNYLLIMFKKFDSGKVIYFEKFNDSGLNLANVRKILQGYTLISFNGLKYDLPVIEAALLGYTNKQIHAVSNRIISDNLQPWQVRKMIGSRQLDVDHIDLIEVAPLNGGLKLYGARLHAPKLQDLPIDPQAIISDDDRKELIKYCENDQDLTILLFNHLRAEIELREQMSEKYSVDLRSKSDAQIAETVIKNEIEKRTGSTLTRPKLPDNYLIRYKAPAEIEFKTNALQELLNTLTSIHFEVSKTGHATMPPELKNKKITIGKTQYKIGLGGLHSCEKSQTKHRTDDQILRDYDVASYYPMIILNNKLTPKQLGSAFLETYRAIVDQRLAAKKAKNKIVADSLKIVINGSFGKFGSKWSILYSPDLMLQVTISGQLYLLMLIEQLELNGISVVSGNTDGIVISMSKDQEKIAADIFQNWEFQTGFELESTDYLTLASRDVNNYLAISDGKIKGKGAFADQADHYNSLRNNPTSQICVTAAAEFLAHQTPIEQTIRQCNDIRQFLTVRTVNGGATKDGEYIGKVIRWYYSKNELDGIFYQTNGNKVPKSAGAVPLMNLPDRIPDDLDYAHYMNETNEILNTLGKQ